MEGRLLRTGRLGEFNRQFQDNMDRGVFRALSGEEAEKYKGPVNYISMVEAFKAGRHATTPLRICMNSSMRQPKPSGVSLNDCLLKGSPALADLYTVMLGMREHKVAFTKDISKFYQCVKADETAQHVRRILWRFCEAKRDPTIFVTMRVNYGDRPAGCIAIAAVWETAARFGEGKEKAAWFLKNRIYVDDATGGASTLAAAKQVSQDIEDILENGGFRFKETVMSGDPLGDRSVPFLDYPWGSCMPLCESSQTGESSWWRHRNWLPGGALTTWFGGPKERASSGTSCPQEANTSTAKYKG
jgi:hypothetical protein